MKIDEMLIEIVKTDLEQGLVAALMGPPGIGKTSILRSIAKQEGTQAFVVACNLMADKGDLTGARLMPKDDTFVQSFFPHAKIAEAIEYAIDHPFEHPILVLDEINRTNGDVTSGALGISTEREIGNMAIPANLGIAVTGNTKGNVVALDSASISRFSIYDVYPDAYVFMNHHGDALNSWVKEALIESPESIFEEPISAIAVTDGDDDDDDTATSVAAVFESGDEMRQLTTPRTITYLSDWLNATTVDKLRSYLSAPGTTNQSSLLSEVIAAKIGNTRLAALVLAKVAASVAANNGPSNLVAVTRPARFHELENANSITDLEAVLDTFAPDEIAASVIYLLSEPAPQERLIAATAEKLSVFSGPEIQLLLQVLGTRQFNGQNLDAFLAVPNQVVISLAGVLQTFR